MSNVDDENKSNNNNNRLRIETTLEATEAYTGAVNVDVGGNLLVSETSVLEREKIQPHFRIFDSRRERRKHQNARERRVATIGERFVRVAVGIGRERKVCAFATRGDEISLGVCAFHGKARRSGNNSRRRKGLRRGREVKWYSTSSKTSGRGGTGTIGRTIRRRLPSSRRNFRAERARRRIRF